MEIFSIGYALLAVQRALLDAVAPELIAVVVDVHEETNLLYIRFYYHGEVSEQLIDLWECAITEASAALGPDCLLDDGVERLDYPSEIPFRGRYAYLRMEPTLSSCERLSETPLYITREIVDFKEKIGLFISPVSGERINTNWGVIHYATDGCHIVPAKPEDSKIEIFPIAYALLATQRALLGSVTPELTAVIVDVFNEKKLFDIHFYYDGKVSEKTIALWECAITEASADFGADYVLNAGVHRFDYPIKIPFRGRYAYLREEVTVQIPPSH